MGQGFYLSQKMALTQTLAPQMQQSLALLQAPTLELQALVEHELEQNPLLEEQPESSAEEKSGDGADPTEPPSDLIYDPAQEKGNNEPVDDWQFEIERLAQLDQEWRDYFTQTSLNSNTRNYEDEDKRQFMLDSIAASTSLQEELREQVRLSDLPASRRPVADLLIGNIDEYGYIKASVAELAFACNEDPAVVREVLDLLQTFDPPGIATRDLRECLMKQLERNGRSESLEYRILGSCFELLGKRHFSEVAQELGAGLAQVQEAVERISHLDPRPGNDYLPQGQQYIYPEVFVELDDSGEPVVSTNNDHIPRIRICNTYKDLLSKAESSPELREYIREKIKSGKDLIRSVRHRQETIAEIAGEIVRRQRDFFMWEDAPLIPLTMLQVAQAVGVHETTVSRTVSGKYLQCSRGLFRLKHFFTSGVMTASGEKISNDTVKHKIEEMVHHENPAMPLPDQEIVRRLKDEEGISVARRTVNKYRRELQILPSHLRKDR